MNDYISEPLVIQELAAALERAQKWLQGRIELGVAKETVKKDA